MTRLSVNLNKVALLRNSRRTGVPDVVAFGRMAREAGAEGLTVHPRPDERHIRRTDVFELAEMMAPWRPGFELNIEGYPDERLAGIVSAVRPEQVTLVPDAPGAFTSEEGWQLAGAAGAIARDAVAEYRALGSRVVLFIDPDPAMPALAAAAGAQGVEVYTGGFAAAFKQDGGPGLMAACAETARRAAGLGLVVNIGHDLNLANLPPLMDTMRPVAEASIGHELTADALMMGFGAAVRAYRAALNPKL